MAFPIPRFGLYGEPEQPASDRLIHVETIARRSQARDWTIGTHGHAALHHLLVISAGGGEMRADGRSFHFEAAILIVPAGVAHSFRFTRGTIGHVVTIGGSLLRAPALCQATDALFQEARVLPGGDEAVFEPILERLARETGSFARHADLAGASLFQLLLVEICRMLPEGDAATEPVAARRAVALVSLYRQQLDRHIADGWTVSDHARALGVSLARLRACCAEVAGASPIRLLHDRLIAEARRQLVHSDRTAAEIGYYLGFEDPAYFSRFFRRRAGAAPGRWRTGALDPRRPAEP